MGAGPTACCARAAEKHEAADSNAVAQVCEDVRPAVKEPLTRHEIGLVQKSWKQAEELGVDTVGVILFRHIFDLAPAALELFPFRSEPGARHASIPVVKEHAVKVVRTVAAAVDSLENLPALAIVLEELAIKHVGYGVQPAHYDVVGKALIKTLQDGLKNQFTPPVQLAWLKVWYTVSTTMVKAAQANAPLTEREILLVRESWAKAAIPGAEAVGVLLFRHIFTLAPEAKQLFKFKEEANLYESKALKTHATKVVVTVATALESLHDLENVGPVLQGLGSRHVGYGVLPAHYDVVGKALIQTLKDGLGQAFTAETEAAWGKVYGILSKTMLSKPGQ